MRDDAARLLDMLLAAREAAALADGLTFAAFESNRMAQLAILKAVETVGEAASHVGADTRESNPEIPWSGIVGMRHRLVHGYFRINLARVWGNGGARHTPPHPTTRTSGSAGNG